jgi:DNA-binding NtrC family response regulator
MRERLFREDLYYRLSVVRIPTPSLREIPEDVPILANHFLQKHCTANLLDSKHFTAAAISSMSAYSWPGNARQLENEVKRLVASVRTSAIDAAHLLLESRGSQANSISAAAQLSGQTLRQSVDALERKMIQQAIDSCAGNKAKAAQTLGLSRQGLIKKLRRLGVE